MLYAILPLVNIAFIPYLHAMCEQYTNMRAIGCVTFINKFSKVYEKYIILSFINEMPTQWINLFFNGDKFNTIGNNNYQNTHLDDDALPKSKGYLH